MPDTLPAEQVYIFRHAMLREAAYELQPASQRGHLHVLAMDAIESLHAGDDQAFELAGHAAKAWQAYEGITANAQLLEPIARREYALLVRAADYAEARYNHQQALDCHLRCLKLCEPGKRIHHQHRAASLSFHLGNVSQAESIIRAAAAASTTSIQKGACLVTLAGILRQSGRAAESEAVYHEALAAQREAGDRRTEGVTLTNLAAYYVSCSRHDEANRALDAALAAHRDAGNLASEGIAYNTIGSMHLEAGRLDQAYEFLSNALAILRQTGRVQYEGVVRGNLAYLYTKQGNHAEAEAAYVAALAIARDVNDRRLEGVLLGNLGILQRETGDLERSRRCFVDALAIHNEMDNPYFIGVHATEAALTSLALGAETEARALWLRGTDKLRATGSVARLESKQAVMREACRSAGVADLDVTTTG